MPAFVNTYSSYLAILLPAGGVGAMVWALQSKVAALGERVTGLNTNSENGFTRLAVAIDNTNARIERLGERIGESGERLNDKITDVRVQIGELRGSRRMHSEPSASD